MTVVHTRGRTIRQWPEEQAARIDLTRSKML